MSEEAQLEHTLLRLAKTGRLAACRTVRLLATADLGAMHEAWRDDFVKTLDDVAQKADMVRALVRGTEDIGP